LKHSLPVSLFQTGRTAGAISV